MKKVVLGYRVGWLDSCSMPSRIHRTEDGNDTACGGHAVYLKERTLAIVPVKKLGNSRYCKTCFKFGGKALPWYPGCKLL